MTQSSSARISAASGSDSRSPSSCENSHGLPSEPRASGHRGGAGALERLPDQLRGAQAAGDDHRDRQLLHEAARELIVGLAGVALRGVARMDAQAGDDALLGEPAGDLDPAEIAGPRARSAA